VKRELKLLLTSSEPIGHERGKTRKGNETGFQKMLILWFNAFFSR
jgi:hypothetical protein